MYAFATKRRLNIPNLIYSFSTNIEDALVIDTGIDFDMASGPMYIGEAPSEIAYEVIPSHNPGGKKYQAYELWYVGENEDFNEMTSHRFHRTQFYLNKDSIERAIEETKSHSRCKYFAKPVVLYALETVSGRECFATKDPLGNILNRDTEVIGNIDDLDNAVI